MDLTAVTTVHVSIRPSGCPRQKTGIIRSKTIYIYLYCHELGVILDGVWIGERFLEHLHTPLVTTTSYGAIANLHTSQITTTPVNPFSIMLCFHQPFPGNGFKQ
jgi:hypothetical protein